MSGKVEFAKLKTSVLVETGYRVYVGGKIVGYVWSKRGFSYRGMDGWNRGVRLQDFHPLEWYFGSFDDIGNKKSSASTTRGQAVKKLLAKGAKP